jgi:acyl-CoA thioesterase
MSTPEETARRSAQAMWAGDAASQGLGMRLAEVRPGAARLEMTVREDMVNGHGIGHGGFTFSLADSAFAFACNTYNRRTVAHTCQITYTAPTRLGDVLVAEAEERSREGRDGVYDVVVSNAEGVVARFVGNSKEIRGSLYEEDS